MIQKRFIKKMRDGHHLNSTYWQDWKRSLPGLTPVLREIAVAMVLSDASMQRVSKEAYIKFKQGYAQRAFVFALFELFAPYCFMEAPAAYVPKTGKRAGLVKSW
jgi:hypothetical protein